MNEKLQQLVNHLTEKLGLEQYELATYSCHKETMFNGETHYICDLEFFPNATKEQAEEDYTPPGTANIIYNLTLEKIISIHFVGGQSFSTQSIFNTQSVKEVAQWIEQETGYRYDEDFTAFDTLSNGYLFEGEVHGYPTQPEAVIEVEFDEVGKLTTFHMSNQHFLNANIPVEDFTLTIDNVQPEVKLEQFPLEDQQQFISVYLIDEIYMTNDGKRIIPHFSTGRETKVNQLLEWQTALEGTIEKSVVDPYPEVPFEEAFSNKETVDEQRLTKDDILKIMPIVTDVFRTVLSDDSGKWTVATIEKTERFIEVICTWDQQENTYFERKFIILLNSNTFDILNYIDNGELFEIFDSFTPAPVAKVSKEEAYVLLADSVSLTPTYIYDAEAKKFRLCGVVNAMNGVDASTGELLPLS